MILSEWLIPTSTSSGAFE